MKKGMIAFVLFVGMASLLVAAEKDEKQLIALDKEWGEAGTDTAILGRILAEDVISVDGAGVVGKKELLAADPGPDEPYKAGDYKVRFLDDDTAIMVHSVGGAEPHLSMHVWVKRGDKWQVVATSSTPLND